MKDKVLSRIELTESNLEDLGDMISKKIDALHVVAVSKVFNIAPQKCTKFIAANCDNLELRYYTSARLTEVWFEGHLLYTIESKFDSSRTGSQVLTIVIKDFNAVRVLANYPTDISIIIH